MNVDFSIHRQAEWTMLMLGESILSLLIVDVPAEDTEYFTTFYCSLLTVIFLCYLHFRSMPHSADDHVMRRSKNRAFVWYILNHAYSLSLVAIGAAFTLFLLSFSRTSEDDGYRRDLLEDSTGSSTTNMVQTILGSAEASFLTRALAGGGDSKFSPEQLEERAANLFSAALAVIFFALDGMSLMHVGFSHSLKRCKCAKTKRYNIKGNFLVLCRVSLIVFAATLSQWETNPQNLALDALVVTISQIVLRKLGQTYLNKKLEHLTDSERGSSDEDDDDDDDDAITSERNPQLVNTFREDPEVTHDT